MEYIDFNEIVNAVSGKVVLKSDYYNINKVSTDTRNIEKDDLFIALKGENFDGNEYLQSAIEKGANVCIVSSIKANLENLKDKASVILVEDTRKALLDLAKYYRSKLNIKVVGITGSTGKTSTKDLVAAALSGKYKVYKTKGNFNNEVGVPLTIFNLNNSYDIAVIEMGMSNLGEIHRLAEVAKPDISLISNIGISHLENLKTRENILKAKMEITDFFTKDNVLIINNDNDMLQTVKNKDFNIVTIGIENKSNYQAYNIVLNEESIQFNIKDENNKEQEFKLNVLGKHNIYNALMAIVCARNFNISFDEIKKGFLNLEVTSMRLEIIKGNKITIVNDCYNASPDSMVAAIDVLANIKSNRKIAIVGTMRELGDGAFDAHKQVGEYAKLKNIDLLFAQGDFSEAYLKGFEKENSSKRFLSSQDMIDYVIPLLKQGDTILVKASRSMKFENIVEALKKLNN